MSQTFNLIVVGAGRLAARRLNHPLYVPLKYRGTEKQGTNPLIRGHKKSGRKAAFLRLGKISAPLFPAFCGRAG